MSHGVNKFMLGLFSLMFLLATALFGASQYEEKVVIPKYNPNDPTHVLITPSNGNWNRYVLNDPNKKHFYVKPGKYPTKINLTRSGTKESRRTLSLYNGNDTHPAALPMNQVADVRFYFDGASYWTIDRMANFNETLFGSIVFLKKAVHNIINRIYIKNYSFGIIIHPFCHYNTIQNSYLDHMTHAGRMADNVGIALANNRIKGTRTEGTKIINNDIRNANDGIQLVVSSNTTDVQYPNTIIDSNRIWMDGDIYTNGDYAVNGYNQNGKYMIGENAMDLKTGSNDPAKPVIVINNIIWGYQRADKTGGGFFSGGSGTAVVLHYGVYNIKINDNIIADSQRALAISALGQGIPYSAKNLEFKNNILYNLNTINPTDDPTYACFIYNSDKIDIQNNTFVNIPTNTNGSGYFFRFQNTINSIFSKNLAINSYGTSAKENNRISSNYYYSSIERFEGSNEHHFNTADQAKMTDYTFIYERFTTHPKQKTLKGIVTTKNSPHYSKAGAIWQVPTLPSSSNIVVYEDAEDGNTNGWSVYDNTPAGATISNVYDENRQSSVIELNGDGWNNGYVLRKSSDGTAWNNTEETIIQWSMNYSERFLVYISVETIKGHRYIYYTPSNSNGGLSSNGRYIHHGLGSASINGEWQTFTRDLEADLKEFESDNDIISVNAFLIRGNGKVDDVEMFKSITVYENAEDGNTNGWSVYDNTPAGATISNVYDENRQSSVIELNGDGWNNGYVLRKSSDGTAWNNTEETIIQWSMNYSERFLVYISVETIKGHRYIYYTPSNSNGGLSSNGRYIHHGLGSASINGEWQTFTRDLEADLKEFESDNDIISVNAFLIRGNGKVDDVQMSNGF